MKVVSFLPFGLQSKEAGLITVVSNYLKLYDVKVQHLLCNGIVSTCLRDKSESWQRSFSSCLKCISEQSQLASWAGQERLNLSPFLHPKDIDETKRWILGLSRENLPDAEFEGLPLAVLSQSSLDLQFGSDGIDLLNRASEVSVRRVLLSAARIGRVFRRYAASEKPAYVLIAGGQDYLSAVARLVLREKKIPVSLFSWNQLSNEIIVENPASGKVASYPLVFEEVTKLRPDAKTWPIELPRMLEELLAFVDLAPAQVALPLAR